MPIATIAYERPSTSGRSRAAGAGSYGMVSGCTTASASSSWARCCPPACWRRSSRRRVRVPGLVLFLAIGMLVGTDGAGWIDFDDYAVARTVGIVALILILFEGGLAAGIPEIRPVLGVSLTLAIVGTVLTAVVTGLVAAWLFDFDTTEGLLVGSIVAGTDGAAIFALLRGSTLRRRLARTLEGESGLNDPIAVLLVRRVHPPPAEPGLRAAGVPVAVRAADRDRRRGGGRRRLRGDVRAARGEARQRRAVPGRDAGGVRGRVRRRRHRARLRVPGGVPGGVDARQRDDPGAPDDRGVPRGHGVGRAVVDVLGPRVVGVPEPARPTSRWRGRCWRWCWCSSRGRWRRCSARRRSGSRGGADGAGVGGPARRGAGRARDLPGHRPHPARGRVLQHRVLRRAVVHHLAGDDVRAAGQAAGRDDRRPGAAAAAGRVRDDPAAGRRGAGVPGRAGRRDRRAGGARPRAAARGGRQRHRP